jgi:hypothetical protein
MERMAAGEHAGRLPDYDVLAEKGGNLGDGPRRVQPDALVVLLNRKPSETLFNATEIGAGAAAVGAGLAPSRQGVRSASQGTLPPGVGRVWPAAAAFYAGFPVPFWPVLII